MAGKVSGKDETADENNAVATESDESNSYKPAGAAGATPLQESDNEGSTNTAGTSQMCSHCVKTGKKKLPDDRNKWPIAKIETGSFKEICNLLDLDRNKVPLLSALECFSQNEVSVIEKKFHATGGLGVAKEALDQWGTSHHSNNVGALKNIVENTMKRVDVIQEFESWEMMMSICNGCGAKYRY